MKGLLAPSPQQGASPLDPSIEGAHARSLKRV